MRYRETMKIADGRLMIGGVFASELAAKYGTPLYVMDEALIDDTMAALKGIIDKEYDGNGMICFASKAFSSAAIYAKAHSFGLGADVVSGGELYTALLGGMPAAKLYFHGNNKTLSELNYAVKERVGCIVIDSLDEIPVLDEILSKAGSRQKVLIRTNPGIEAHTHHFVQTARPDSKFGFSISDDSAFNAAVAISKSRNLDFFGIHCHIGSQIFESKPFLLAVKTFFDFAAVLNKQGIAVKEFNFGGGYGAYYTEGDEAQEPGTYIRAIIAAVKSEAKSRGLSLPRLVFEPGRSLVAEAGVTLYTVGNIKEIEGIKKYISVDGGMFENPRYALYQARYSAILADRAEEKCTEKVTVAGKCCESGDILIDGVMMPKAKRGDILAIFTTGAYNYSMASNYNRNVRPPVIMVKGGKSRYIVRPETYEDVAARDVL